MQLAYSSLACPQWNIEEAVAATVRYGYDAIEWRLADGEIITPETPAEVRRRLRVVPADHGISIACLDTSCRVVQASAQERTEVIETAQHMADIAVELGTPYMRVFGGALPPGETNASILAPTAEVVARIGACCAERNITAVLETHDSWSRSDDVRAVLDAAASPAVKMLWDIHHTYRSGEAPAQSVAQAGQAIAFVHAKDGRPRSDDANAWELCLLGEGTIPLPEAFSALKRAGYDGYVSLEWEKKWHPEIAEPEIALPQGAPWLRRAWDEA